jgi:cell division transport system permease protein
MGRLFFFFSEAFRALRRSAAPSFAATVTIIVTTLLLGVLVPVLKASQGTTDSVRDEIGLNVYLYDDASKAEISALRTRIEGQPHVDSVAFVSKNDAVKILQGRLKGDLKSSLNELPNNPLPASFKVALDDPDNLEAVRSSLTKVTPSGEVKPTSSVVSSVGDQRADANKIRKVTGAVKILLIILAILLPIASLMLVANTIRLSIYARRREVEVMTLVGATKWFVRWPFVIEGMIIGFVGASAAVGILWIGKVTIFDPLKDNFTLVDNFSTVGFAPLVALLIGSAILVSALGSGVTLRRFLRV